MFLSIHYLRALAVLMVLWTHTIGFWGSIGVDIFFIISGFLMMFLIDSKRNNFFDFFLKRFIRVTPMYWIFTIITLLIGFYYIEPSYLNIFLSFIFLKIGEPILSIGWTLQYEFIFYSICSLSLFFFSNPKHSKYFIIFCLLSLSLVLDFLIFTERKYGIFLEFIYGILLYSFYSSILLKKKITPSYFLIILVILIGIILSFVSLEFFVTSEGKYPYRFLSYGVPAFLITLGFILLEVKKNHILPNIKSLNLIGSASYSIYLSHTTFLGIFYIVTQTIRNTSVLLDIISLLIALLFGIFVYWILEVPLLKKINLFYKKSKGIKKIRHFLLLVEEKIRLK